MTTRYDASFARRDTERRARHGKPWQPEEWQNLRNLYMAGMSLEDICKTLQRPADGTVNKLLDAGLIRYDSMTFEYYVRVQPNPQATPQPSPPTKKETPVSKPLIEAKILINGVDATDMSDTEIFRLIAKTEAEIASLESIKTPSKKLADAISKLKTDVVKLAEYVDQRV